MKNKVHIDIVILSFAKTEQLKQTTLDSIKTLLDSEDSQQISFEILVIESNKNLKPYQYSNTKTIYPDVEFGYNKYLNIGINLTSNKYICFCNNDLVYHKNWAGQIIAAMENDQAMLSAGPYCPTFHKNEGFDENGPPLQGYFGVLGGWCIFVKREVFNTIGLFDEKLVFWYSDADYCQTLIKYQVKHCLVPLSKVTHLGSESLKTTGKAEHHKLTQVPRFYYGYKWIHHSWLKYQAQVLVSKIKMLAGL